VMVVCAVVLPGPLVFTIIMTVRQLTSIILSCLIYSHPVSQTSLIGAVVVFSALGYRIKRKCDKKRNKAGAPGASVAKAGSDVSADAAPKDVEAQLKELMEVRPSPPHHCTAHGSDHHVSPLPASPPRPPLSSSRPSLVWALGVDWTGKLAVAGSRFWGGTAEGCVSMPLASAVAGDASLALRGAVVGRVGRSTRAKTLQLLEHRAASRTCRSH